MSNCGATKCLTVSEEDMSSSDHDAATVDASMEDAARQTTMRRNRSGDQARSACTSTNTKKAYQSYLKGVSKWIHASQPSPDTFFCEDRSLNLTVFSPQHFEAFLPYKINEGKLKLPTLSGYRSAVKDVYRQKRLDLPSEYLDDLKTQYQGFKRVEAVDDQSGRSRRPGKEPLSYSLYAQLTKITLGLQPSDFTKANRKLFSEWTVLVRHIVAGVERDTQQSIFRPTTQEEVDRMYHEGIVNVPMKMPANPEKQRPDHTAPYTTGNSRQ